MKTAFRTLIGASAIAVLSAGCASGPDPSTLGRLGWMVGCWQSADGANTEVWSAPSGRMMFGNSTTVQTGTLAFFQQARINLNASPATYTVSPNGQRAANFMENTSVPNPAEGTLVVFENDKNEFPQRITYASTDADMLTATASKMDGSQSTSLTWQRCAE